MATKSKAASAAKSKGNAAPASEHQENRYVRVARVMIEQGENVGVDELVLRAGLDERTAKRIRSVLVSVFEVLREAKLLAAKKPAKKTPAVATPAPEGETTETEPAAA